MSPWTAVMELSTRSKTQTQPAGRSQRQRRIDRRRLAGFEVREPLHVGVEAPPDFIDRRFHRCYLLRLIYHLRQNSAASRSTPSYAAWQPPLEPSAFHGTSRRSS